VIDGQSAYPSRCRAHLWGPWADFSFSFLLPDNCFALRLGVPSLTRGRLKFVVQSVSGQSHRGLITVHYCLIWDYWIPFPSPLTTSRDYGGSILTHLHTGLSWVMLWPTVSRPIRIGVGLPFEAHEQIFLFPLFCRTGVPKYLAHISEADKIETIACHIVSCCLLCRSLAAADCRYMASGSTSRTHYCCLCAFNGNASQ
jgi:hypothetical protein